MGRKIKSMILFAILSLAEIAATTPQPTVTITGTNGFGFCRDDHQEVSLTCRVYGLTSYFYVQWYGPNGEYLTNSETLTVVANGVYRCRSNFGFPSAEVTVINCNTAPVTAGLPNCESDCHQDPLPLPMAILMGVLFFVSVILNIILCVFIRKLKSAASKDSGSHHQQNNMVMATQMPNATTVQQRCNEMTMIQMSDTNVLKLKYIETPMMPMSGQVSAPYEKLTSNAQAPYEELRPYEEAKSLGTYQKLTERIEESAYKTDLPGKNQDGGETVNSFETKSFESC